MQNKVIQADYLLLESGLKEKWGVQVQDNRIVKVAPNEQLQQIKEAEQIYLHNQILLPGFVNGHNHMYGFYSHGISADAVVTEFSSFLEDFWWPYVENRLDHRYIQAATKWACIEMIESGVTSFVDILEAPNAIPGGLDAEKEVVQASGLRGKLTFEACERISKENADAGLMENDRFVRENKGEHHLVQGINSIHTLFTGSDEFIRKAKRMADENGAPIHMHLSESCYEGDWCREHYQQTPVERYEQLGYLDRNVLASQVVQVSDKELDILAKHQVSVVSMPISNCEVGGGFAPVSKMLDRNMTVGLGTDGYVNNFFEVMRAAFLVHKANQRDPQVMPAKTVYQMATSMGAKAIGLEDAGSIREGNLADLISVDILLPTPINEKNIYDQLILFCNPHNVVNVMVDGQWLKRDGVLTTMDKEKARQELRQATEEFWKFQ